MPRRITPTSSLETLKREAKDWLAALRANDAAARARLSRALSDPPLRPTLRDVQLALARELGYAGWTELKADRTRARTAIPRPTVASYERMAAHLLDAYRTGTPEAMERHWHDTWHRRAWDGMRRYVQLDLGKSPDGSDDAGGADITLDDARLLVAREHGFASWAELAESVARRATLPRRQLERAVRVFGSSTSGDRADIVVTHDWDEALELLRSGRATGLEVPNQATDAMLEEIAHVDTLETLLIPRSHAVSDAGVRRLAALSRLRELDVAHCVVGDDGASALASLAALERLNLSWTQVSDVGIAHAAACPMLERVDLAGTPTGDGALRAFAGKPRLRYLDTGRAVSDAGLAALHDYPMFRTSAGEAPVIDMLSLTTHPNRLTLRGAVTDRGIARLAGLDGLFALDVSSLAISPEGLAPLADLSHLGTLSVTASDDHMARLAALPVLRFLLVQDTDAGDRGFAALARSQSIELLWGRRCENLGRAGFVAMASMPRLRSLSVSLKHVDDAGLAALPRFPALRELMPIDAPDAGYRHIGRCRALERLVLMYCRETTDAATSHLTRLDRLRSYYASYTQITDRTPELLAGIRTLESVELHGCQGVTDAGVRALARLPVLRELILSGMPRVTSALATQMPSHVHVRLSP